ncbi:Pao retrotransposon peptidase superfamily [Actinomyces denticolens]|nr:Pao retrotransposon peptidase superfamily [Actinomyces denticolens]
MGPQADDGEAPGALGPRESGGEGGELAVGRTGAGHAGIGLDVDTGGAPSASAAAAMARAWSRADTDKSRSAAIAARRGDPGAAAPSGVRTGASQVRMRGASGVGSERSSGTGRAIPAASRRERRWRASASWATPSQVAPVSRQARATGSRPCP